MNDEKFKELQSIRNQKIKLSNILNQIDYLDQEVQWGGKKGPIGIYGKSRYDLSDLRSAIGSDKMDEIINQLRILFRLALIPIIEEKEKELDKFTITKQE